MANLSSESKPMGSIVIPDCDASCECVFLCKCALNKEALNMPEMNDSCRPKMGTTNTNDPHKHCICNSKIPKCDFWGTYRPPKDTNTTLEKSRRSSNFATCLIAFCLQEPKGKLFKLSEIHLDKPIAKFKVMNGRNINMRCYDIILEIYLKIFTAKELYDHDFLHINNTMIHLRTKGLVTEELLFKLRKTFKENGYISSETAIPNEKGINVKGDDQIPDALKYFNHAGNKYFAKEHQNLVDYMNALQEKNNFSDSLFANFMEPIERGDIIISRLNLACCLGCPNVLENLKELNKEELLVDPYLSKYMKVDKLADNIISEVITLEQLMKDSPQKMEEWVCSSVHNTPFCDKCGLQISWLKTFRKKGISIREDNTKNNNKHVWQNNIKEK